MIWRMSPFVVRFAVAVIVVVMSLAEAPVAIAQSPSPQSASSIGDRLMAEPAVTSALEAVRRNEPNIIDEQIRLCEIPAPPFKEQKRAEAYKAAFEALGLKNVRIDAAATSSASAPARHRARTSCLALTSIRCSRGAPPYRRREQGIGSKVRESPTTAVGSPY